MTLLACGLCFSLGFYLAAIYGLAWSASRRIKDLEFQGFPASGQTPFPSVRDIWSRHSVTWILGFFVFFLILGLTDFPLWQRLGIGAMLALYFGSVWFDQSGRNTDREISSSQRLASNAWYWSLAVADWLGFMWTLCFASALVIEVL